MCSPYKVPFECSRFIFIVWQNFIFNCIVPKKPKLLIRLNVFVFESVGKRNNWPLRIIYHPEILTDPSTAQWYLRAFNFPNAFVPWNLISFQITILIYFFLLFNYNLWARMKFVHYELCFSDERIKMNKHIEKLEKEKNETKSPSLQKQIV